MKTKVDYEQLRARSLEGPRMFHLSASGSGGAFSLCPSDEAKAASVEAKMEKQKIPGVGPARTRAGKKLTGYENYQSK